MDKLFELNSKQTLRKFAQKARLETDIEIISQKIVTNIKNQLFFKKAQNILFYYPFNHELNLLHLLENTDKKWFLPRIDMEKRKIIIHSYQLGDKLVENKWKVFEPDESNEKIAPSIIDLIIIPALMADKTGHRLGYGAGFYDKFLPLLNDNCIKIIPIIDKLFINRLPSDDWDKPANFIVTEAQVFQIKNALN